MSSPQDPSRRKKEKIRRTKKLLKWREKKAAEGTKKTAAKK